MEDMGVDAFVYIWCVIAPVWLFLPVVLVKWGIVRKFLQNKEAFLTALGMNLISVLAIYSGATTPFWELLPTLSIETLVLKLIPNANIPSGEPPLAFLLFALLAVSMFGLTSVVIEGILLTVLQCRRAPLHKIWWTALVANVAGYSAMAVLTYVPWKLITFYSYLRYG